MQIPRWPIATEREKELIDEVLASPHWGGFHEIVARFEAQFAAAHGCRFGISAANGTLTLELALLAAGIGPGDEVIVPAISFISTATAVSRVGAIPVFVDIEPYTFNMNPSRVQEAVSAKTRAVMPVHFGGPLVDMDRIADVAARRGLIVIEDAAHAHGSQWQGRPAGSFGLLSSFSFQNGKVMTAGEGGIVLTNDEALAAKMRSIANQGRRPDATHFHHFTLGTNFRITALQAAVLVAQLERLPAQIETRTANACKLLRLLEGVDGIRWQQVHPKINRNSWYLMLGRVEGGAGRDEFCRRLREAGVPCSPYYPHTLYQNPLYRSSPCRVTPCPNAEATIADAFWIPHNVLLGAGGLMEEVAEAVRRAILRG